ncbi:MAG: nucleotidyl transferase AbiEii/AbiGii toxin family protein, partial [Gemmatimonadaceae bacterium]|nr:nucleotidyl transferase AbiEii/AbiGii toxin family protein [Gloeobacterales cyanobacterium ES-bin-141]
MNTQEAERWTSEVLDEVFEALAASEEITSALVFKGARVLRKRLDSAYRQSTDIDSNLLEDFAGQLEDRLAQAQYLQKHATVAIQRYFNRQDPIRYELTDIRAKLKPQSEHPMGWNAIELRLSVKDLAKPSVRAFPALVIDVAAPEELLKTSIAPLMIGENAVQAYTLERLAGEKLRAFLSSLPAYQMKMRRRGNTIRVKDIYDLAVVGTVRPLEQRDFWHQVGQEFQTACRSRFIDCAGLATFEEGLERTRKTYESDPTLPKDVHFDEAWAFLRGVVQLFEDIKLLPF